MLLLVLSGGPGDGGGAHDGNGGSADGDEKQNLLEKSVVDGASGESAIAESGGEWWR